MSIISMTLVLAGCPDPQGRFDEYVSRVPDATVVSQADAPPISTVPDVNGTFLFSIYVSLFPSLPPIRAIATTALDTVANKVSISINYVDVTTGAVLTGAGSIASFPNNPLDPTTGVFTVTAAQLVIPAQANALGADATATSVVISGTLKSADFYCGTVEGLVQPQNAALTGSTFGAIRIPAGQSGSQLPNPVKSCAQPDAGL
jgi:hypothetical protein